MTDSINVLRQTVADYDKLKAENEELRADIISIAKALNVTPFCIPGRYLNEANDTMVKVILAVLKDANINAHELGAKARAEAKHAETKAKAETNVSITAAKALKTTFDITDEYMQAAVEDIYRNV